jgi:putative ABC transport system substrate-binding protein
MNSRRAFISLLCGVTASWPAAARSAETIKRVGVLQILSSADLEAQPRTEMFEAALRGLGWAPGSNLIMTYRWGSGDLFRLRNMAMNLVDTRLDVIVGVSTVAVGELSKLTKTQPIVFVGVPDPVGLRLVDSLAKPGGNVTGFMSFNPAMSVRLLQILKDIAPSVASFEVLFNPTVDPESIYYTVDAVEIAGRDLGVNIKRAPVRDLLDIQSVFALLAGRTDVGIVVLPSSYTSVHRAAIIELANLYAIPAIYPFRFFAEEGGLVTYGNETSDLIRGTASYVDKILLGASPADLPVQMPTKFELVINLKTAKALALTVPEQLLAQADQLIQ